MPIRFRCVYCKQLMGISRRKAGKVVRCPKCSNQVMVPVGEVAPPAPAPPPEQPIFERSDFDELINQAAPPVQLFKFDEAPPPPAAAPAPVAPPPAAQVNNDLVEEATALSEVPPQSGILLSPGMATALAVCVIIGLALAFVVGLFIGYKLRPKADAAQTMPHLALVREGQALHPPLAVS